MASKLNNARKNGFQWTIARKVVGLAMVLIVFILALLLYSITSLRGMQGELKEIAELDVPLTELINMIEIQQLEQQIVLDQLMRPGKKNEIARKQQEQNEQQFHVHSKKLDQHIKAGIKLSELGFQTEFKSIFEMIHTALLEVQQEANSRHSTWIGLVERMNLGIYPDEQTIDQAFSQEVKFDKKILALIQKIEAFTEREINILEKHNKIFFMVNSALGVAGVLIGTILSLLIIVGIRSKLFRLTQRVSEVTQAIKKKGSISTTSMDIDSSDEIGKLANKLSLMLNNVSKDFKKRDKLLLQLKQVATTDKLTGAFNRLKWEENQALETKRTKRNQDELSLIFFDIDFFKKVNDTFGHDVGDQVLIEIVRKVKEQIRQTDSLYRTGGEEFIILTPNTSLKQAGILANKVRTHDFETVGRVTVSMGCAQFDKKKENDTEQMLKRADQALYRAKESGRNQVILSN